MRFGVECGLGCVQIGLGRLLQKLVVPFAASVWGCTLKAFEPSRIRLRIGPPGCLIPMTLGIDVALWKKGVRRHYIIVGPSKIFGTGHDDVM